MKVSLLIKYILSITLIVFSVSFLVDEKYICLVKRITLVNFLTASIFCSAIFAISGMKIASLAYQQFKKRLSIPDIVSLPVTMNLISFFIPFKGGLFYLIFFLKKKYKVKYVEGISISTYNQLITLVLYGLLGMGYIVSIGEFFSAGAIVAVLLILSPLIITILHGLMRNIPVNPGTFLGRGKFIIDEIVANHNRLWSNFNILVTLFILSIAHTFFRVSWIYLATRIFGLEISSLTILAMAMLTELSIIIRFVPGNLGVYELLSGGMFQILGQTAEEGILIALFLRLITFVVTFTVGLLALNLNLKYFEVSGLRSVWKAIGKPQGIKNNTYHSES